MVKFGFMILNICDESKVKTLTMFVSSLRFG